MSQKRNKHTSEDRLKYMEMLEKGYSINYICKRYGINDMGRPKKKKPEEMTELERLRYENEYLKAENALLKKVKALVEEREARQRGTGRKPSKN